MKHKNILIKFKGCDIIEKLAYSLHLGSDKNKKNISRKKAKANKSGSTSLSNNAIQNARQLSRVDKHNYRKYDDKTNDIVIIRGTTSLYDDIKTLYKDEFEEARIEYNSKQIRENRKIQDYFSNISNNDKNDLACEIIIELGDKYYWNTKDIYFKKRMTSVYSSQVKDLELILPDFKIASAIIHYDETSPHMHIVGVPIKYKNKNGMSKQVGKSSIFTKDTLKTLQDKMRTLCIESFNKEYNLNNILNEKMKGRNQDKLISEMSNYLEMKKELQKNKIKLDLANKKSIQLNNYSNEIKIKLSTLKHTLTNKDNLILTKENQNDLNNYITFINNTNEEFKNIKPLSIMLNDVDEKLKINNKTIKDLTNNNKMLNLKVKELTISNDNKSRYIDKLENEIHSLKESLQYFKNLFNKLINFINNKLFSKNDKEKYYDISVELYTHNIIKDDTFQKLKDNYNCFKDHRNKEKDDFER